MFKIVKSVIIPIQWFLLRLDYLGYSNPHLSAMFIDVQNNVITINKLKLRFSSLCTWEFCSCFANLVNVGLFKLYSYFTENSSCSSKDCDTFAFSHTWFTFFRVFIPLIKNCCYQTNMCQYRVITIMKSKRALAI